jgi:hypothetical protein
MSDRIKNIVKETIKKLKEESSTGAGGGAFTPGEGAQYATKYSFKKGTNKKGVKKPYYYKLGWKAVPNKIKGSDLEVKKLFEEDTTDAFQQERLKAFEDIENELNSLSPMISNAKNQTVEFYQENPGSNEIIISTDLILEYIQDIKKLLKGEENENP